MALTLEAEQKLEAAGLVEFYEEHTVKWFSAARETKAFVVGNFPPGSLIRRDDVAKALLPIIEVSDLLKDRLNEDKLRGKIWIKDFVDLIVDRTWDDLDPKKVEVKDDKV